MKIAITGKGGVGKTTLAGLLARYYAEKGYKVLAVDADPDANLASALGISEEEVAKVVPLADMADLIEERTGAKPGSFGAFFKMNPKVDDIPDNFALEKNGIKLLIMGTVKQGGGGCVCPENVLLRTLMRHLLVHRQEVVIMDMEAGIEHLGRSTADSVDALLIVIEPGLRSIQTAQTIKKLASDIGLENIYIVFNKIKNEEDEKKLMKRLTDWQVLGRISYNEKVLESDMEGISVYDVDEAIRNESAKIGELIENKLKKR